MKQLRDLPVLLGIAGLWSILWAALTWIAGTVVAVIDPDDIDAGEEPIVLAPIIGLAGFLCGIAFGALLLAVRRGQPILELPLTRVAFLGMLIGAALSFVTGKVIPEVVITGPLGALSGIASIAILRKWARRAQPGEA